MRPTQTLRTTADIKNPTFDGRCRYGIEAHRVIPAGTFVLYRPACTVEVRGKMREFDEDARILLHGKVGHTNYELRPLLRLHSEPAEPETVAEILMAEDFSVNNCDHLLGAAIRAGLLTRDQLRLLCRVVEASWEEEV